MTCKVQLALGALSDNVQVVVAAQHKAGGPWHMHGCTEAVGLLPRACQLLQKLALVGVDDNLHPCRALAGQVRCCASGLLQQWEGGRADWSHNSSGSWDRCHSMAH